MPLFKTRRFRRRGTVKHPKNDKTLATELSKLVDSVPNQSMKKAVELEMQAFSSLFSRYTSTSPTLNWDQIATPTPPHLVAYEQLPTTNNHQPLNKLAVLKFSGGLGTTMGLTGAKIALEVSNDMTFLDHIVRQVEYLNTKHQVDIPLILMTSFNTVDDTIPIVKKYANNRLRIETFNQSRYPRVFKGTHLPCANSFNDDKKHWYPPGHGDLYTSLFHSGVLDQLIAEGKEYLFASNSDNLGTVADEKILQYMIDTETEFLMEVTDKTKADITGGSLVNYEGSLRLLELAQVPDEHIDEFKSLKMFRHLNTNNLWINLRALKRLMDTGGFELDIIAKLKAIDEDTSVIQLETTAGCAIKYFKNAAVRVPRDRFVPVKNCSDLLLVKSDIYFTEHGRLRVNESRIFSPMPTINLGDRFKNITQFQKRFKGIPNILELDHLTVTGDVFFGRNVTLRGTVIIIANEGQRIDIPDNSCVENRLLCGELKLTEL